MPNSASSVAASRIGVVPDGYLRVSGARLLRVRLQHLLSGLDEEAPEHALRGLGATAATLAGFTEWVGGQRPAISVGWDWQAGSLQGALDYQRVGPPRSNLMLVDDCGRDLGFEFTAFRVGLWLDQHRWQTVVAGFLSKMYA
jgi:hypothetical protein